MFPVVQENIDYLHQTNTTAEIRQPKANNIIKVQSFMGFSSF